MIIKHNPNTTLLVSGRLISLIGSGIQTIGVPLYILDSTGSASLMAAFTALSIIPALISAPMSGVLGDHWSRKKLMVLSDAMRGVVALSIGIYAMTTTPVLAMLFIMQIFISCFDTLFSASSDAILPDLTTSENLPKLNAFKNSADNIAMILGPVMGGFIFGLWGLKAVLLINGVSFIVSGILESLITLKEKHTPPKSISLHMIASEIKVVYDFVITHRWLKRLFGFTMLCNFMTIPAFFIITPYVLIKKVGFDPLQFSYLQAIFMGGLLLGNTIAGLWLTRTQSKKLMQIGLASQAVLFIGFAWCLHPKCILQLGGASGTLFAALSYFLVLIGLFSAIANLPIQTHLQLMVKPNMRSRFFSVHSLLTQLTIPLGSTVYGFLLDQIHYIYILIFISTVLLLAVIQFIFSVDFKSFNPAQQLVDSI